MIKAGIVGGTGYTGVELLRLLVNHTEVELSVITSRAEAGSRVADLYPNLRGYTELAFSEPDVETLSTCDVVFFATPHGVAQNLVPVLFAAGVRIIDLSADFRIRDADLWAHWYAQAHGCPELIGRAVYGLPEMQREAIKTAQLVACPGCYPTSAQLALMPLLKNNLVNPQNLIVNAASGATGAGRQAKIASLLTEVSDSFKAYACSGHRHLPEIEQGLQDMQAEGSPPASVTFVPHLLPMIRGIHTTVYAESKGEKSLAELQVLFEETYASEPFVDVLPQGVHPETRSVKGSNTCRIAIFQPQQKGTIVILSVIDNLTKGASGQAIQNMNIMFGFDESAGLRVVPLLP